jgi:transcription-repair coupling factor (superfamily II helicase)
MDTFRDIIHKNLAGFPGARPGSGGVTELYSLRGSGISLFISLRAGDEGQWAHLVLTRDAAEAEAVYADLCFWGNIYPGIKERVFLIGEGDDPSATGRRLEILSDWKRGDLLVGSLDAFSRQTFPPDELKRVLLHIRRGDDTGRTGLIERLIRLGYRRVSVVNSEGEFCERSWVFDVFPCGSEFPVRIEFFGEEVEAVKSFDPATQRSLQDLESLKIFPLYEKREGWTVLDHFMDGSSGYLLDIEEERAGFIKEKLPGRLYILQSLPLEGGLNLPFSSLSGLGIMPEERMDIFELPSALKALSCRALFVVSTEAQAKRLRELAAEEDLDIPFLPPEKAGEYRGRYSVTTGRLREGFRTGDLLIITSTDLFGKGPPGFLRKQKSGRNLLERIEDLRPGDYLVHRDHGIGRYAGLSTMEAGDGEVMVIEYADGAVLYLPVHNIGLVSKYRAPEGVIPAIDKLGSRKWKKRRALAQKKIRELAKNLLALYAHREVVEGYPFSPDTELHREFETFFPYEETADQARAWEVVKGAMEAPRPMDMLLCGDVGFGKTEIAMRAAFKAVYDSRQVAVLVPTTILAEQHYRTFRTRFTAFPVRIDYLSRFKTTAERKRTLELLKKGDIDIIIGTHALLGKAVRFSDLGLLIVDEEHRFGVRQKERIKELKKGVDCLTMSATPIPRTLEMSLSGIREMTLIETPPEERLAVRGMVTEFREDIIREAIERERQRGGQVFFVHNRISELDTIARQIKALVPGVKMETAHGRMKEKDLEDIMLRFMEGEIELLLSTSIIGSGIDVPRANTIIVNRADRMGLADLYQLKGRVGRGDLQAYAYFVVPSLREMKDESRRRIRAIEELNYLGAGLKLAMKDLEIRGAGNLLGQEQSGHISAVGFDLYMEMLSEEVARLKGEVVSRERIPRIDLKLTAFIPDVYIPDPSIRLGVYRRLHLCHDGKELDELLEEMDDRFGPPPEEVMNLIRMVRLRLAGARLGVSHISLSDGKVCLGFFTDTTLGVDELVTLRNRYPERVALSEDGFSITADGEEGGLKETVSFLEGVLKELSSPS